jgi:hypothetical protein
MDLRALASKMAHPDLVAMSALIYRAAEFARGPVADRELTKYRFPLALYNLPLGRLLWLVRSIGLIADQNGLRFKQRTFPRTDLNVAIQAGQSAIAMLKDWPQFFREILKRMIPATPATALNFAEVFGNFYRHLFRVLPRQEFGFLHEAFEQFVIEDWNSPVRQRRYFTPAVRRNTRWMSADEAERSAHVISTRIVDLVRQRRIQGVFVNGRGRTECWVNRESLDRWIRVRDAEMALYTKRPEAVQLLGLKNVTVLSVARAGLIRYVQGADHYFPAGFHFLREDVLRIADAFKEYSVLIVRRYSKPGELIALRHALKNYLGRDHGLPAAILAVLDGSLVPMAYTKKFPGITGYLFTSKDLRRYRPVHGVTVTPEGVVNYREAADILGVAVPVIRGLVAQGMLRSLGEHRNGFSKLLPAADVRQFAKRYVAISVLARRFHLNGSSLARYLRESGSQLLAISSPDTGRGHAYFLSKEIAGQIRIPSCRMLREQAESRIKVARKQRWASYSQAKESALGNQS